jgi:tRNA pseudouridine32 synthase/23S rRNA pseudouridine746 synthase
MSADTFIAPPCHEQIRILFEDSHLILIDKPSGLLSLSGKNPLNKDSVHYRLVQNYPTATMVHRLDFGTSGVMILALKKEVNANLTKQFQERSIVKQYTAILFGHLDDDEGTITAPLTKAQFPYQKVCAANGKEAQSHYQVLQRMQDSATGIKTTRVLFTPRTGRTHQLRVHSLEIGHPIIGCDLYGLDIKGLGNTQSLASRLALHANSLEFTHPVTEQRMLIRSPRLLAKSILQ